MTPEDAQRLLGLPAGFDPKSVPAAIERRIAEVEKEVRRAKTDDVRAKLSATLDSLAAAGEALLPNGIEDLSPAATMALRLARTIDSNYDDDPPTERAPGTEPARVGLDLRTGSVLSNRYEIRERIGYGGMGAVFRAWDRHRREEIAIKVPLPGLLHRGTAAERFHTEAKLSSALSHPSIVNVFDVQKEGDTFYLTMELLTGKTLRAEMNEAISRDEPFPLARAIEITTRVCEALHYAHRTTVHRDVKPENVFLCADGAVKLMDFGIARVVTASGLTKTGAAMGTAYYMAPEQLRDSKDVDHRADQYSVGVMLYELLAGFVPAGRHDPLIKLRKEVGKRLSDTIERALSARADDRFPDTGELADALQRSVRGSRTKTPFGGVATLSQAGGPSGSGSRKALLGVGAALAIAALVFFFKDRPSPVEPPNEDGPGIEKLGGASDEQKKPNETEAREPDRKADPKPDPAEVTATKAAEEAQTAANEAMSAWQAAQTEAAKEGVRIDLTGRAPLPLIRAGKDLLSKGDAGAAKAKFEEATKLLGTLRAELAAAVEAKRSADAATEAERVEREAKGKLEASLASAERAANELASGIEAFAGTLAADTGPLAQQAATALRETLGQDPEIVNARAAIAKARESFASTLGTDADEVGRGLVPHVEALRTARERLDRFERSIWPKLSEAAARYERARKRLDLSGLDASGIAFADLITGSAENSARALLGLTEDWNAWSSAYEGVLLPSAFDAVVARLAEFHANKVTGTDAATRESASAGRDAAREKVRTARSPEECASAAQEIRGALASLEALATEIATRPPNLLRSTPETGTWRLDQFVDQLLELEFDEPLASATVAGLALPVQPTADGRGGLASGKIALDKMPAKPGLEWRATDLDGVVASGVLDFTITGARFGGWGEVIQAAPPSDLTLRTDLRASLESAGLPWLVRDKELGIDFVLIPAGTYERGARLPAAERDGQADERPQRTIDVREPFYMSRTEITESQWARLDGKPVAAESLLPVVNVTYTEALRVLGNHAGLRLPRESEWEYACRAGVQTAYYGLPKRVAWFAQNSEGRLHEVAGLVPNGFGLFDMLGNVSELTSTLYSDKFYELSPPRADSTIDDTAVGSRIVVRGAGYASPESDLRAARRFSVGPDEPAALVGLRLVRDAK